MKKGTAHKMKYSKWSIFSKVQKKMSKNIILYQNEANFSTVNPLQLTNVKNNLQ